MNRKVTTITAVIVFAVIANFLGGLMSDANADSSMKKNMEEYLRTRYGKEFVLKNKPYLISNWPFPSTTYIAKAVYPTDDPDLKFDITWDTTERTYKDTYLAAKWSKEGKKAMEEKLKELYGEGNFFIRKYFSSYNDVSDQAFTWADLMKNRADRNRIDFYYCVFFDGELDRKKEAERTYKILKENLINYKVRRYNFAVLYVYKSQKQKLINMYADKEKKSQVGMDELYKAGILKDWIRVNYAKVHLEKGSNDLLDQEVKSAEDLLNTRFQIKGGE